jgi:mRNA-degrading endonuclease RelE of RelBE toxin-antitoxin system
LPRDRLQQVARAIDEMERNPLAGDVRPIKSGKFEGALRKRVGRYRIVFALNPDSHRIEIAAILTRSEKTYR